MRLIGQLSILLVVAFICAIFPFLLGGLNIPHKKAVHCDRTMCSITMNNFDLAENCE